MGVNTAKSIERIRQLTNGGYDVVVVVLQNGAWIVYKRATYKGTKGGVLIYDPLAPLSIHAYNFEMLFGLDF